MKKSEAIKNEQRRLKELEAYEIIGVAEEDDYDFITSMAAQICNAKVSFINLITDNKQWFLSHYGLDATEASNNYSYCQEAIKSSQKPLIIEDARIDKRFFNSPMATFNPQVVFYAGIPLINKNGYSLGSLCVIDDAPKKIHSQQLYQLDKLAKQVVNLLEFKRSQTELKELNEQLGKSLELFKETQSANHIGTWELDISSGKTIWSDMVYDIHEAPLDFDHNKINGIDFYHPDYKKLITNALQKCIEKNERFDINCILISAKGNQKWVRSTGRKFGNKIVGSFQDISEIKRNEIKFQGIFNSTFSFIGFLNREGVLLEANDTAVNMAGLQHADVIGKYFWDCYWWQISKETQEELKTNFLKALGGEEVVYEVVVWVAKQTPVTILFSLKPLFDDRGNVIYIIPEGRPVQDIVDARRKYKSVLEGTNVGTWEWNIQTGETVFNQRWADIVGYTLEELYPISIETWTKLAHPDDLEKSEQRLKECFDRKVEYYEIEARMKHKNGEWIWVYDRGKVFEWTKEGKPLMMYGTHQDITDRKNKELELTYQKDILNALYELSPIGIALNDYKTGRYVDVNDKLLEPTGYSKEEFLALSYWDLTPKEYSEKEATALLQMQEKGSFDAFEKEYIRKDGTRYPVSLRGIVVDDLFGKKLIWSFIQDVSKEKEIEKKLLEAISRLQAVLDASTQVSIIATDTKGIITLFNSGAERLLGYKASDLIGQHTPLIIHLDNEIKREEKELSEKSNRFIKGFDIFIADAKVGKATTKEWTYKRKDGSLRSVLMSITAVKENNNITGYLSVAADITELKSVQSEISSLLEITRKQNDRLKNFAHIVSHNLRSHSLGISGLLEIFNEENPELVDNELIQLINKGAQNLKQTVEDLTHVVKVNLGEQNLTHVNVYEVVNKNIDSLALQIRNNNITIENHLNQNVQIYGDKTYLDSIVLNLITNAIKYKSSERKGYLKITSYHDKEYFILSFVDNGLGIDLKKHGDKIFGMYKTFHDHQDSRGVGLFITKNQVESMGGKIEIESEVNVGTTFRILLPG